MVTAEEDTRTFKLGSFTSFGIKNDEKLVVLQQNQHKKKMSFQKFGNIIYISYTGNCNSKNELYFRCAKKLV